jgi:hypothetical protein
VARTNQLEKSAVDFSGRFRLEVDSRADTTCCGKRFVPISEIDQVCDVAGFHPTMKPIKDVPIRTCACAFDGPNSKTLILVIGQALYCGVEMEHSLLSPNQVRAFSHTLCLNPNSSRMGIAYMVFHPIQRTSTFHLICTDVYPMCLYVVQHLMN